MLSTVGAVCTTAPGQDGEGAYYAEEGPWGKLRCIPIYLEAPNGMVDEIALPRSRPRWAFPRNVEAQLPTFFETAGLPEDFVAELLNPESRTYHEDMLYIFPSVKQLEAMTPSMRELIYPDLARFPENRFHHYPILFTSRTANEWLATCSLRPELIAKIKRMTWMRDGVIAFSDVSALIAQAESHSEARQIHKFCSRNRAIMVQLELTDDTDVEALLDYWTLHSKPRRKSIEPIIRSVRELKGVKYLPLAHVLPPLARKLVYTYPDSAFLKEDLLPFCHWTALNFFNYEPDHALANERFAASFVNENFTQVTPPYSYGDMICFVSNGDSVFHSCIYLAADLVYTKNGENRFNPWLIMPFEDVKSRYTFQREATIEVYRKRDRDH